MTNCPKTLTTHHPLGVFPFIPLTLIGANGISIETSQHLGLMQQNKRKVPSYLRKVKLSKLLKSRFKNSQPIIFEKKVVAIMELEQGSETKQKMDGNCNN